MVRYRLSTLVAVGAAWALSPVLATPAAAQDHPLTVDVTEVYRVGGVNAREWGFFQPALKVSFDGAGNLVVLDVLDNRVVVVGPDGQLVRALGRKGEGPGEFQRIKALAVWRDGRVAVPDGEHPAIQVFSQEGEFERFVRLVDQLQYLYGNLTRADQEPGEDTVRRYDQLNTVLQGHIRTLERLLRANISDGGGPGTSGGVFHGRG